MFQGHRALAAIQTRAVEGSSSSVSFQAAFIQRNEWKLFSYKDTDTHIREEVARRMWHLETLLIPLKLSLKAISSVISPPQFRDLTAFLGTAVLSVCPCTPCYYLVLLFVCFSCVTCLVYCNQHEILSARIMTYALWGCSEYRTPTRCSISGCSPWHLTNSLSLPPAITSFAFTLHSVGWNEPLILPLQSSSPQPTLSFGLECPSPPPCRPPTSTEWIPPFFVPTLSLHMVLLQKYLYFSSLFTSLSSPPD